MTATAQVAIFALIARFANGLTRLCLHAREPLLYNTHTKLMGKGPLHSLCLVERQTILNRLDNLHNIYFICGSPKINSVQDLFGAPLSSTRVAKITQPGFSKPTLNGWK
jgi:hypothetical protein